MKSTILACLLMSSTVLSCEKKEDPQGGTPAASAATTGDTGPSDKEVSTAVSKYISDKHLGFLTLSGEGAGVKCGVMDDPIKSVKEVTVAQRGIKRPDGAYALRVTVSGVCAAALPNCGDDHNHLCPPLDKDFTTEKPITVRLKKDDFGAWTVEGMTAKP